MSSGDELQKKIEELRKLAAGAHRKLTEITTGIARIRGELKELHTMLGGPPPPDERDEAEREFDELEQTGARVSRHDA